MACRAGGLLERLAEEEGSWKWGAKGQVSKGSLSSRLEARCFVCVTFGGLAPNVPSEKETELRESESFIPVAPLILRQSGDSRADLEATGEDWC